MRIYSKGLFCTASINAFEKRIFKATRFVGMRHAANKGTPTSPFGVSGRAWLHTRRQA